MGYTQMHAVWLHWGGDWEGLGKSGSLKFILSNGLKPLLRGPKEGPR